MTELKSADANKPAEEMITIRLSEYEELQKDSEFLNTLRNHGVDNWDGYGFALEELQDDDEDED
jgi:hypothetical protein